MGSQQAVGAGMRHMLSFDVEEYFQVSAFWSDVRRQQWDQLESRVEAKTQEVAELLGRHGARATFFFLGWVAERHPGLVKALCEAGHEIASHGYGHELIDDQTPAQFREDVKRAKQILEGITGKPVIGYRAPSFSVTTETMWALSILAEEGYRYDSSVYKRFHRTETDAMSVGIAPIHTSSGVIWEVPPSTVSICGVRLPVAGGGYFRLVPFAVSKMLLKRLEKQGEQIVMYLHPWEIDPGQPRMEGPWLSRARHYLNLHKTKQRLQGLLEEFAFAPIVESVLSVVEATEDDVLRHGSGIRAGSVVS